MYVLTGATGKTGRIIANILLNHGKKIRAIARNTDRLHDLEKNGAEIMPGNLEDKDFLLQAFQGAETAYIMVPPHITADDIHDFQTRIVENQASAIETNNVTHVVTLSSVGAHLPEKNGIVQGLYNMEQRLNQIEPLNVMHIRAAFFMENLFQTIEMVKATNKLATPLDPNIMFPMTGKRDVAKVVVQHLLDLDFQGKSVAYVLGERDVSFAEVADILGKAIGRHDLAHSQIPFDHARTTLIRNGISKSVANAYLEFLQGINEGYILSEVERTPENTTPISIEEFSRQYALLFESREPVF